MKLPYEIADMCKKCISSHIKKKGKFEIQCTPVPKNMEVDGEALYPIDKIIGEEKYSRLPEDTKVTLQLTKNKLLWAKKYLGWSPYNKVRKFYQYYQREYLLCTAKNKVMRFGRRLGKTEGMVIDILHFALMNPNVKVVVVAPFLTLTTEIFNRLEMLLSGKDSVFSNDYTRKKQPSEKIKLSNGSEINGFTTATDGKSIRGQSANKVYIDEGAYIPEDAYQVLMAFKLDNKDVSFNVASTPSALETAFKKWCLTDTHWHEMHYPSSILPDFKEKDEPELRNSLTIDGYQLEVEAEFIEGSARVFKSHNIKNAKFDYSYINSRKELENPYDWYITIG